MDKLEARRLALSHACGLVKENDSGKIFGYEPQDILIHAESFYQFLIKDEVKNTLTIVKEG